MQEYVSSIPSSFYSALDPSGIKLHVIAYRMSHSESLGDNCGTQILFASTPHLPLCVRIVMTISDSLHKESLATSRLRLSLFQQ